MGHYPWKILHDELMSKMTQEQRAVSEAKTREFLRKVAKEIHGEVLCKLPQDYKKDTVAPKKFHLQEMISRIPKNYKSVGDETW